MYGLARNLLFSLDAERAHELGMAVAGLVLGWTMVVISLVALLLVILFFGSIAVLLGWLGLSGHLN